MNKIYKYDIYERIFKFVIEVLRLLDRVSFSYSNQIFKNQLVRSVTSMGANSQEADGAFTTKDFLHCFVLVRKEGKETAYWLKVIKATNPTLSQELELLIGESIEIVAIVSKIVKNTRTNSSAISPSIGHLALVVFGIL
jgi:four helix bundle protein